jgi:tetratricopeptide (TPR) repeat protein
MRISASIVVMASTAAAATLSVMVPATAQAQTEQQWDSCYGIGVPVTAQPPQILIAGCTAVIQSGIHGGRNLVSAFTNRGLGFRRTLKYDDAFSDFDQAIRLDADYLPAYYQRGSLFWETADFERARQDLDQIDRLKRPQAVLSAEELGPGEARDRRRQALAATECAD